MTLSKLQEIFIQDNITKDTTVGEMIDLNDHLALMDSHIVEWDQVDAWLENIGRTSLFSSIEHYLDKD